MLILRVILFQVFENKKLIKLLENQVSFVETTVITLRTMRELYFNVDCSKRGRPGQMSLFGRQEQMSLFGGQEQMSLFGGQEQMSPLTTFINDFQSLK